MVVVGAGSLFFGRQAIWQMGHSTHLNTGRLALVDSDPKRLDKTARLAEMVIADSNASLALEASTKWKDVLRGADFVVLSFANQSTLFRGIDCEVSERFGVRMCSGDTIGPGGIFRAMREFPVILECARDVESLCPNAWVINYINPTTVHGIGLKRFAPKLNSFALCDSLHMPHKIRRYAEWAGIVAPGEDYSDVVDRGFDLRIAGVNHFTWILKAEYNGRDVAPQIAEWSRAAATWEPRRNTTILSAICCTRPLDTCHTRWHTRRSTSASGKAWGRRLSRFHPSRSGRPLLDTSVMRICGGRWTILSLVRFLFRTI